MASKRLPNRIETLPSGVEVAFWDDIGIDGKPQQRRYRIGGVDGEKVPSISTVAGIYDKRGLMPAAVKLQEQGIIALARDGVNIGNLDQAQLRSMLVDAGYHYDSVWQLARDRGDTAHDMLLHLIRDGRIPKLAQYEPDIRPWITAGMKWAFDVDPEVIDAETIVVSTEHRFAGRYDLCCRLRDGRIARVDYKTVTEWKVKRDHKGNPTDQLLPPYDENLIALAGYEIAAPESGYDTSDVRLIVRLGPDGEYDQTESHATPRSFLAALDAYREKRYLTQPRPQEQEALPA